MARGVKRKRGFSEVVDRLSDLPDDIIRHILSLMETENAVQTSVLAKRWRYIWTTVPVLDFRTYSLHKPLTRCRKFVRHVLQKRDGGTAVHTFHIFYKGSDVQLMTRIINYLKSHNVKNLTFKIDLCGRPFPVKFLECQTLETLLLNRLAFEAPISFVKLTSLYLQGCSFYICSDVFSSCPNLKVLSLLSCTANFFRVFKISGPQLLNLTVEGLRCCQDIGQEDAICLVEISTPKLIFFKYRNFASTEFASVLLPSLQHAELGIVLPDVTTMSIESKRKAFANLLNIFGGISNASYLTLNSVTVKALASFPELANQPSPFRRLTYWILTKGLDEPSIEIPQMVLNFFHPHHS